MRAPNVFVMLMDDGGCTNNISCSSSSKAVAISAAAEGDTSVAVPTASVSVGDVVLDGSSSSSSITGTVVEAKHPPVAVKSFAVWLGEKARSLSNEGAVQSYLFRHLEARTQCLCVGVVCQTSRHIVLVTIVDMFGCEARMVHMCAGSLWVVGV